VRTDRRAFIGGAAAAALAPLAGFPAIVKRRNPNSLLSHACIGTGNMAMGDRHALAACGDLHITALCDVDSRYLAAAKRRHPDARVYRDAFEMMAAEGNRIDSVNVSTPDHTHAQYIVEALSRGLNVYAQKPLCHDLGDCQRIEKLAAEKKAVTQMGTQIAAWECDRRTAAAIRKGVIGEIRHVWLFSTRRSEPSPAHFRWPLEPTPVPSTLEWKLWLGPVAFRPFVAGVYHPRAWRRWRAFGTSWLGDLGLHLMSPVWLGMDLGATSPASVIAEVSADEWTAAQREQFWPTMSHVVWTFPGVKASGLKPFTVEWCDGFGSVAHRLEPKFLPPAFLQDIAARTPMKRLPSQGRVIEGTRGWILSTHFDSEPCYVMKDGSTPPDLPAVGAAPSHYREYVDACLGNGKTTSGFERACRLTEWGFVGNLAQLQPGRLLDCAKLKGGRS
jgi:predicted dehydrogenase